MSWSLLKSFCFHHWKKGNTEMLGGFNLRTTVKALHSVSLKLCWNVWSFKWLKPKWSLVSNFIPIRSCIEKREQLFTFMKLRSSDLYLPKDSAFLVLLSNLFHYLIQHGKNECLKLVVLDEIVLSFIFVIIWCYKLDLYYYSGRFRRHVRLHVHVPTHVQKCLDTW